MDRKPGEAGDHKVRQRTGGSRQCHARLWARPQPVGVDRRRLAPAEADDEQEKSAHRVEVRLRIERQTPQVARGAVAKGLRSQTVAELVEGDAHEQRSDNRTKEH